MVDTNMKGNPFFKRNSILVVALSLDLVDHATETFQEPNPLD
jgi:hypothetical protein